MQAPFCLVAIEEAASPKQMLSSTFCPQHGNMPSYQFRLNCQLDDKCVCTKQTKLEAVNVDNQEWAFADKTAVGTVAYALFLCVPASCEIIRVISEHIAKKEEVLYPGAASPDDTYAVSFLNVQGSCAQVLLQAHGLNTLVLLPRLLLNL
eukprot:1147595-Pelagomonas_calceolata.AAC.17